MAEPNVNFVLVHYNDTTLGVLKISIITRECIKVKVKTKLNHSGDQVNYYDKCFQKQLKLQQNKTLGVLKILIIT